MASAFFFRNYFNRTNRELKEQLIEVHQAFYLTKFTWPLTNRYSSVSGSLYIIE